MTYAVRNTYTYPDGYTVTLLDATGFATVWDAQRYLARWHMARWRAGLPVGGSCTCRADRMGPRAPRWLPGTGPKGAPKN
jgi:hypothetical protein